MYFSASKLLLLSLAGYAIAAPSGLYKRAQIVIGFRSVQIVCYVPIKMSVPTRC